MSADNFLTVVPHPDGGWAVVMGFMSNDEMPEATSVNTSYKTPQDAYAAAMDEMDQMAACEYGIIVSQPARSEWSRPTESTT